MISATITIDLDVIAKEGLRFDQALDAQLRDLREQLIRQYERDQLLKDDDLRIWGHTVDELKECIDFAQQKGWDASQSR